MTTITVHDPAMCCSTGICGTEIDQRLVDLAADLDFLKSRGVRVQRFGLSREPAEIAADDTIRQIMQDSDGDDLPVFMIDGILKARARYPGRAELAGWAGLNDDPIPQAPKLSTGGGTAQTRTVVMSGCCVGGTNFTPAMEKAS